MDKYVRICFLGEGSYGYVTKCRNAETGELVAVKKFPDSDKDKTVKKIALREIKMLKQLVHENLVNLVDIFSHKKKIHLVFEYVERTLADDLEDHVNGIPEAEVRPIMWQVLKGIEFCHDRNVIHRDIKPENILISKNGVVKVCDFGFARCLATQGCLMTDYVATRWYRAPELLVGDVRYGRSVDVWAVGCLVGELMTGEAVFSGSSDVDQFFLIVKCLGSPTSRLEETLAKNGSFRGVKMPQSSEGHSLKERYQNNISEKAMTFLEQCLQMDDSHRPDCSQLLKSSFFTASNFHQQFPDDLRIMLEKESNFKRRRKERSQQNKKQQIKIKKHSFPEPEKSPRAEPTTNPNEGANYAMEELKEAEKRLMCEKVSESNFKDVPPTLRNKKTYKETLKMQCHNFPDDAILSNPDCYHHKHRNSIFPQITTPLGTQLRSRSESRVVNTLPTVSSDTRLLHSHLHHINSIYNLKPNFPKNDESSNSRSH